MEQWNRQQIEALNQRGGRTLSIVDLVLAGTVDVQLAAYLGQAVRAGASFLTAANPGGVGKTALLAALLGFLPLETPIVTVDHPDVIANACANDGKACYLAHEIGSGHWYGYIWGPVVGQYFDLASHGHVVASCLHADTMEEVQDALHSCRIEDPDASLEGIDLVLFMQAERSREGYRRRLSAVYERNDTLGTYGPAFLWNPKGDRFQRLGDNPNAEAEALAGFLRQLVEGGTCEFGEVRNAYLDFTGGARRGQLGMG